MRYPELFTGWIIPKCLRKAEPIILERYTANLLPGLPLQPLVSADMNLMIAANPFSGRKPLWTRLKATRASNSSCYNCWPGAILAANLIEKGGDSIIRYDKSRKADRPFIATVSHDKKWIAATYTAETGNLWTNPERSCQYADPSVSIKPGESKILRLKTFVFKGSPADLLTLIDKEQLKWIDFFAPHLCKLSNKDLELLSCLNSA